MKQRRTDNREGFSLVEVLISIALFSLIVFLISGVRGNVGTLSEVVSQKLQSRQDIDVALKVFVSEIRSAGPSSLGGYPLEAASTSSVQFYSDIDSDGLFERVRYTLGTTTLQKAVLKPTGNPLSYVASNEATTTVITNVITGASTTLAYYGTTYTGTQAALTSPIDITQVRLVRLSALVDIDPSVSPKPVYIDYITSIRNLRSN